MESSKLRIAFDYIDGAGWTGGTIYLKNLLLALRSVEEESRPGTALIVPSDQSPDTYKSLSQYADHVFTLPEPTPQKELHRNFGNRLKNSVNHRVKRRLTSNQVAEHRLGPFLRQHEADALFSMLHFGPGFRTPLLSWIPDFQHVHMPQMFTANELKGRDKLYSGVAQYADRVILSSQSALDDFLKFAPDYGEKARVLSFVANIPPETYNTNPSWICSHYELPQKFFYLPNQFWKHKNHEIVIEALYLLKDRCKELTVVCTGNTSDSRNPTYFSTLLSHISERGVRDRFINLGFVPHEHTFQLIRQSIAVLQPSLFEGWSTTVEETKSVGKRMILSNLPVHREQDPPKGIFFNPHDAQDLADCLVRVFNECSAGPDLPLEQQAREHLQSRVVKFGENFIRIAKEVT